jgi:hypothetical protein
MYVATTLPRGPYDNSPQDGQEPHRHLSPGGYQRRASAGSFSAGLVLQPAPPFSEVLISAGVMPGLRGVPVSMAELLSVIDRSLTAALAPWHHSTTSGWRVAVDCYPIITADKTSAAWSGLVLHRQRPRTEAPD